MKHYLPYFLIIICIIFVYGLFISGALDDFSSPDFSSKYRTYFTLQENMIDAQETEIKSEAQNIQLKESLNFYQDEMIKIIDEINEQSKKQSLIQEKSPKQILFSPTDRIIEEQVKISRNSVTLDVEDVEKWYVVNTDSMIPVLDEGSTLLTIKPGTQDEIKIGDIIFYNDYVNNITIVHRVISIEKDVNGTYFVAKGDNNKAIDPTRVRFEDIEALLIGIIY